MHVTKNPLKKPKYKPSYYFHASQISLDIFNNEVVLSPTLDDIQAAVNQCAIQVPFTGLLTAQLYVFALYLLSRL